MIWVLMLAPFGVLNGLLTTLGLLDPNATINWLGSPQTSLLSVTAMNIWRAFPFFMVMLLAGLQAIPEDVYEAADIDGTTARQKFWYITLPALRGIILTVVLLDSIWTFRAFDPVYVMTGGGPINSSQVLATVIYFDAFRSCSSAARPSGDHVPIVCLQCGVRAPRRAGGRVAWRAKAGACGAAGSSPTPPPRGHRWR
jgi:multiple sugar transport system permease protein